MALKLIPIRTVDPGEPVQYLAGDEIVELEGTALYVKPAVGVAPVSDTNPLPVRLVFS